MPPPHSHGSAAAPRARWLRPWIAGHLSAARAGFFRGPAPDLLAAPQRSASAARGDQRFRRLARTLDVVMVACLLGALAVLLFGGFHTQLGEVPLRMTSLRSPLRLLVIAGIARAVLLDISTGAWPLARSLAVAGRVPLGVRLALLPWGAAAASLVFATSEMGDALGVLAQRGRLAKQGVIENAAHRHLAPIIGLLAHRSDPGPVAIYIEDVNPRGHLASFYAYPRLLCMDQDTQSWSLRVMMWRSAGKDPAFADPGERPPYEQELAWARAKGIDLLRASPEGARVVHAGGEQE